MNPRLLAMALLLSLAPLAATRAEADREGFVGSATCARCHAAQSQAWTGSHHDLAMQHAGADTVLGEFDAASITVHGLTSRFFTRDDKYWVNTDGADGKPADFEVAFTFGVTPLQQYLVAFPDGRLQALPLAWDSRPAAQGGQRWFHLYPDAPLRAGDELHWTGLQQNWNYQCADCHSTNLRRGYDAANDRFDTTWSQLDVGCEACHGPGEAHLAWVGRGTALRAEDVRKGLAVLLHDRQGISWPIDPATGIGRRSAPPGERKEMEICATCHSRRGQVHEGMSSAPVFLDHYLPSLLERGLYHVDGQVREEVYEWGSFAQSRMHAAGVTCSDCHEPHSLQLRAPGEAVCAQCHQPSAFATTAHHGHPQGSPGSDCLACHMPETTYMVVDPRRDHSLRSPRPDLSAQFGTPDACAGCHADRSQEWLVAQFNALFPDAKPPFQSWTRAFHQAAAGLPQAEVSLLAVLNGAATPDIVRARAVAELRDFPSPLSAQALAASLRDDSPLVRLAALRLLDGVPPQHRFALAGHLLTDPLRSVRIEAGRQLVAAPRDGLDATQVAALDQAVSEYVASQQLMADRPEANMNLGNLYAQAGDAVQAERAYRQALRRDPGFAPGWLNLADLYRAQGMEPQARDMLAQGLAKQPENAALHHALGLSLVRGGQLAAALPELADATRLAPDNARFAYVEGVALNSAGRTDEAVRVLVAAQGRHPNDAELMFALATIERDRGEAEAAAAWARRMLERNPADARASQLLQSLGQQP